MSPRGERANPVSNELLIAIAHAAGEPEPLTAALGVGRALLRAKRSEGGFSVRALDRHPDCELPRRTLRTYLAVAEQWETLGDKLGSRLPLSQHVELLAVREPEEKMSLAERAAEQGWTVKELRFHAADYAGVAEQPVQRAKVRRLARRAASAAAASSKLLQMHTSDDSVALLDPRAAEAAAEDLERYRDAIAELADKLRAVAGQGRKTIAVQRRQATIATLSKYDRLRRAR